MPPIIKWKCFRCGHERIMSPDSQIVLCRCNSKQMTRIGNIKILGKVSDGAIQQSLFGPKKVKKEDREEETEIIQDDYDPDKDDLINN